MIVNRAAKFPQYLSYITVAVRPATMPRGAYIGSVTPQRIS